LHITRKSAEVLHHDVSDLSSVRFAKPNHPLKFGPVSGTRRFTRIGEHLYDRPTLLLAEIPASLFLI
jgi:hypothetical protein